MLSVSRTMTALHATPVDANTGWDWSKTLRRIRKKAQAQDGWEMRTFKDELITEENFARLLYSNPRDTLRDEFFIGYPGFMVEERSARAKVNYRTITDERVQSSGKDVTPSLFLACEFIDNPIQQYIKFPRRVESEPHKIEIHYIFQGDKFVAMAALDFGPGMTDHTIQDWANTGRTLEDRGMAGKSAEAAGRTSGASSYVDGLLSMFGRGSKRAAFHYGWRVHCTSRYHKEKFIYDYFMDRDEFAQRERKGIDWDEEKITRRPAPDDKQYAQKRDAVVNQRIRAAYECTSEYSVEEEINPYLTHLRDRAEKESSFTLFVISKMKKETREELPKIQSSFRVFEEIHRRLHTMYYYYQDHDPSMTYINGPVQVHLFEANSRSTVPSMVRNLSEPFKKHINPTALVGVHDHVFVEEPLTLLARLSPNLMPSVVSQIKPMQFRFQDRAADPTFGDIYGYLYYCPFVEGKEQRDVLADRDSRCWGPKRFLVFWKGRWVPYEGVSELPFMDVAKLAGKESSKLTKEERKGWKRLTDRVVGILHVGYVRSVSTEKMHFDPPLEKSLMDTDKFMATGSSATGAGASATLNSRNLSSEFKKWLEDCHAAYDEEYLLSERIRYDEKLDETHYSHLQLRRESHQQVYLKGNIVEIELDKSTKQTDQFRLSPQLKRTFKSFFRISHFSVEGRTSPEEKGSLSCKVHAVRLPLEALLFNPENTFKFQVQHLRKCLTATQFSNQITPVLKACVPHHFEAVWVKYENEPDIPRKVIDAQSRIQLAVKPSFTVFGKEKLPPVAVRLLPEKSGAYWASKETDERHFKQWTTNDPTRMDKTKKLEVVMTRYKWVGSSWEWVAESKTSRFDVKHGFIFAEKPRQFFAEKGRYKIEFNHPLSSDSFVNSSFIVQVQAGKAISFAAIEPSPTVPVRWGELESNSDPSVGFTIVLVFSDEEDRAVPLEDKDIKAGDVKLVCLHKSLTAHTTAITANDRGQLVARGWLEPVARDTRAVTQSAEFKALSKVFIGTAVQIEVTVSGIGDIISATNAQITLPKVIPGVPSMVNVAKYKACELAQQLGDTEPYSGACVGNLPHDRLPLARSFTNHQTFKSFGVFLTDKDGFKTPPLNAHESIVIKGAGFAGGSVQMEIDKYLGRAEFSALDMNVNPAEFDSPSRDQAEPRGYVKRTAIISWSPAPRAGMHEVGMHEVGALTLNFLVKASSQPMTIMCLRGGEKLDVSPAQMSISGKTMTFTTCLKVTCGSALDNIAVHILSEQNERVIVDSAKSKLLKDGESVAGDSWAAFVDSERSLLPKIDADTGINSRITNFTFSDERFGNFSLVINLKVDTFAGEASEWSIVRSIPENHQPAKKKQRVRDCAEEIITNGSLVSPFIKMILVDSSRNRVVQPGPTVSPTLSFSADNHYFKRGGGPRLNSLFCERVDAADGSVHWTVPSDATWHGQRGTFTLMCESVDNVFTAGLQKETMQPGEPNQVVLLPAEQQATTCNSCLLVAGMRFELRDDFGNPVDCRLDSATFELRAESTQEEIKLIDSTTEQHPVVLLQNEGRIPNFFIYTKNLSLDSHLELHCSYNSKALHYGTWQYHCEASSQLIEDMSPDYLSQIEAGDDLQSVTVTLETFSGDVPEFDQSSTPVQCFLEGITKSWNRTLQCVVSEDLAGAEYQFRLSERLITAGNYKLVVHFSECRPIFHDAAGRLALPKLLLSKSQSFDLKVRPKFSSKLALLIEQPMDQKLVVTNDEGNETSCCFFNDTLTVAQVDEFDNPAARATSLEKNLRLKVSLKWSSALSEGQKSPALISRNVLDSDSSVAMVNGSVEFPKGDLQILAGSGNISGLATLQFDSYSAEGTVFEPILLVVEFKDMAGMQESEKKAEAARLTEKRKRDDEIIEVRSKQRQADATAEGLENDKFEMARTIESARNNIYRTGGYTPLQKDQHRLISVADCQQMCGIVHQMLTDAHREHQQAAMRANDGLDAREKGLRGQIQSWMGTVGSVVKVNDVKYIRILSWFFQQSMKIALVDNKQDYNAIDKAGSNLKVINVAEPRHHTLKDNSHLHIDQRERLEYESPVFAHTLLIYPDKLKQVIGQIFGDTLVMTDINSAHLYRERVVSARKRCPTIVCLDGRKLVSNGIGGGKDSVCPPPDKWHAQAKCNFGVIPFDETPVCVLQRHHLTGLDELIALLTQQSELQKRLCAAQNECAAYDAGSGKHIKR